MKDKPCQTVGHIRHFMRPYSIFELHMIKTENLDRHQWPMLMFISVLQHFSMTDLPNASCLSVIFNIPLGLDLLTCLDLQVSKIDPYISSVVELSLLLLVVVKQITKKSISWHSTFPTQRSYVGPVVLNHLKGKTRSICQLYV